MPAMLNAPSLRVWAWSDRGELCRRLCCRLHPCVRTAGQHLATLIDQPQPWLHLRQAVLHLTHCGTGCSRQRPRLPTRRRCLLHLPRHAAQPRPLPDQLQQGCPCHQQAAEHGAAAMLGGHPLPAAAPARFWSCWAGGWGRGQRWAAALQHNTWAGLSPADVPNRCWACGRLCSMTGRSPAALPNRCWDVVQAVRRHSPAALQRRGEARRLTLRPLHLVDTLRRGVPVPVALLQASLSEGGDG